jgi:peptide alpha-N-acetyltransferase
MYPDKELPTVYLWTLFYLAQHLDIAGRFQEALDVISEAIEHSPTLLELYMMKARIYKVYTC